MTILSSVESVAFLAVPAALAGAFVAAVVTLVVIPLTIRLAHRLGVVDEPGARSSHVIATPRLGGIAVAIGGVAGLVAAATVDGTIGVPGPAGGPSLGLVIGTTALLFGCIGLADDLGRGIPVSVRLVAQLVIGVVMIGPWVVTQVTHDPGATTTLAVATAALAAVWVIGYVNAFNFMDGVDGISGFVAIVVGLDLALVGLMDDTAPLVVAGLVLVGAAAGFLPGNLRRATVFLGDGGSYFLGGWIATGAVVAIAVGTPPEAVLAVTVPYLADTTTTLLRRVVRREDWRASHHEHAYQQLIELGWTHRAVSGTVAATSALCAALGLVSLDGTRFARVLAALAVVAVSAAYVSLPHVLRRRGRPGTTRHQADDRDGDLDDDRSSAVAT